MSQHCRRSGPQSIRTSPGLTLVCAAERIRVNPDYGQDDGRSPGDSGRVDVPGSAVGRYATSSGKIADMADGQGDALWEQFVTVMLATCPLWERASRYGDKPALFAGDREIAHLEAPGVIDLRITRAGWSRVRADFGDDPALARDPSRRDWIELHLQSAADVDRLRRLLTVALEENQ
jgi:hypothetical protein